MRKYTYLPHTADVEFKAYGMSLEEVVTNSILALLNTICDINRIDRDVKKNKISKVYTFAVTDSADASYPEDIIWYTLQDVLSIADSKGLFAYSVKSIKIDNGKRIKLKATLSGIEKEDKYSSIEVKGISRYQLSIKKIKDKYVADVVIDV